MKKRKLWVSIFAGFLAFILTFGLIAGVLPSLVGAASVTQLKSDLDALKADKKELDKEINKLEGQLSDNLDSMEKIVKQKNTIDQQIFNMHEKVTNLNAQIATYGNLIADKQEELDVAQGHLAELNLKNKERIRAMEEDGGLSYWSVLFKANSFADLLDRLNMIEEIAASDQRRLKEMSEAAKVVEDAKATLEVEMANLEENKLALEETQKELEVKREETDKLLAELDAIGAEYEALLDDAEDRAADLALDIKNAQNAYNNANRPSSSDGKPASKPTTNNAPNVGGWIKPVKYTRFSSAYGWRIHPVYKVEKFHYGVDLGAPKGTPIWAAADGKVEFAKWDNSAGYYVKIDHGNGFDTIYMHMTHYIVKKGDVVKRGDVIGYVGSTGTSTGAHLHFGMTYKGAYVNPADHIKF